MNLMFFRAFFPILKKKYFFFRYSHRRDSTSLRFLLIMLLLMLLLMLPTAVLAIPLTVVVHGVEGEEHKNIMASIKIAFQQENSNLTLRHIRRLHKAAPEQIAKALAPLGYYSVEVKDGGSLTKNDTGWHAVYEVVPGPPVLVDQVNIEVTGPGKDEEFFRNLKQKFPLKKGERLKDTLYEKGKKKYSDRRPAQRLYQSRLHLKQSPGPSQGAPGRNTAQSRYGPPLLFRKDHQCSGHHHAGDA